MNTACIIAVFFFHKYLYINSLFFKYIFIHTSVVSRGEQKKNSIAAHTFNILRSI